MTPSEILKLADYPENWVVIDFEAYFDAEYSLKKMSNWAYIKDERFEVIGCGFKFSPPIKTDQLAVPTFFIEGDGHVGGYLNDLEICYGEENLENITVVIQNAQFDQLVLQEHYGIKPKYVVDIKHLDAHFDSRRSHALKDIAKREGLPPKGDTKDFIGLHLGDMTPEQRAAMESYCKNDIRIEYMAFEKLMPYLTNPAVELPIAQHTTDLYLNPRFDFDYELADKLTTGMTAYIEAACKDVNLTKEQLSGNLSFVTALQTVLPDGECVPTKAGKRPGEKMTALLGQPGVIPALAKTDEGCLMLLAHPDRKVYKLMEARKAVKSWPLHVKRVAAMRTLADSCKGVLPVPLNYYGCHTGRWSGGGGINLFNLGGAGRAGQGTHPLITKMRQLLRVDAGKLLISDAAQIEARILAWLAGQEDMLQAFADGRDIYSEFGTKLFAARLRKPRDTDPPPIYSLYTIRRGFAKDTILGAGFGMGANKFHQRCLENPGLRPMFDSGQYDRPFVQRLINGYRTTYSRIPAFWKTCERCFKLVVKYPHEVQRYALEGSKVGQGDLLTFWNDGGTVNVQLPSGRVLYYPHAVIRPAMMSKDHRLLYDQLKYHHGPLWGGTLTENIVQAIARDLLVYWILECEKQQLPVLLHVYDEIIALSSEYFAEENLSLLMAIMSAGPSWAAGLPLAAEGQISDTYKK